MHLIYMPLPLLFLSPQQGRCCEPDRANFSGKTHLSQLADDAMTLPVPIADEGFDRVVAEDDVLVVANLHSEVSSDQDVQPPRAW